MEANLYIDVPGTVYVPGDPVAGKVLWALERPPGRIRLSLGWWTEGRGSRDAKIEAEQEWQTDETAGEREFSFSLPESPYSFNGPLISLKWALEISATHSDEQQTQEIIVSPHGVPVELTRVPDEGGRKSFSFFGNR